MLVLSRQRDETIMIGDDIEITIVDIEATRFTLVSPRTGNRACAPQKGSMTPSSVRTERHLA